MSINLNEEIYRRFGLQIEKEKVQNAFLENVKGKLKNLFLEMVKSGGPEKEICGSVMHSSCKGLLLNKFNYQLNSPGYFDNTIVENFIEDAFRCDASEDCLLRIQIVLNAMWELKDEHEKWEKDIYDFIEELEDYINDYPILGIIIKRYKSKAPQILPSTSKQLDKEVIDTLGVLDTKKFKIVLEEFESSLKLYSNAKSKSNLVKVVDGMHGVCDEIVKIILNDNNKSFRSVKKEYGKLNINAQQKEIFIKLKETMDSIKHRNRKTDREEIEMIISMTAAFIRLVATKNK
jgi:hypothetical protein